MDERENRILGFLVRDYVKTAMPVSSVRVREGLGLKESPATIRNIVAELDTAGFLEQPHTSAGRVPTDRAYRYFVDNLMSEVSPRLREVSRIQRVAGKEYEEAGRFFADALKLLSIVNAGRGHFIGHGFAGLLKEPEFRESELVMNIGYMMDNAEAVFDVYRKSAREAKDVFIGRENPARRAYECGVFYIESAGGLRNQAMLLIGPKRMDYEKISGYIEYFLERI